VVKDMLSFVKLRWRIYCVFAVISYVIYSRASAILDATTSFKTIVIIYNI